MWKRPRLKVSLNRCPTSYRVILKHFHPSTHTLITTGTIVIHRVLRRVLFNYFHNMRNLKKYHSALFWMHFMEKLLILSLQNLSKFLSVIRFYIRFQNNTDLKRKFLEKSSSIFENINTNKIYFYFDFFEKHPWQCNLILLELRLPYIFVHSFFWSN